MSSENGLTPEFDVTDMRASINFYRLLGFEVVYERAEERFAFLSAPGASLMLQEADGPGRRFQTAPLERPHGRGVNMQLHVAYVDEVYRQTKSAGYKIIVELEERWYLAGKEEVGHRQFVGADPDGYLWRPFSALGTRAPD